MSEEAKELVRRGYKAMNDGDFAAMEALVADNLVDHEVFPGYEPTKQGVLKFFRDMRAAFPDMNMSADAMISEGDIVVVRGTMSGTHKGDFLGMPATNKKISVPFADFLRVENGKLAEHWGVTDNGALMEQLGAMG